MNFQYNDGGRQNSGLSFERRDCTVRAMSAALDLPYYQVHAEMEKRGRKLKHGARLQDIIRKNRTFLGYKLTNVKRSGTVGKFLDAHPEGRFVATVVHHAFAIIAGTVHDMQDQGRMRRIRSVWKVEKPLDNNQSDL